MTSVRTISQEDAKTFVDELETINLPTGQFDLRLLRTVLNTLPFEIDLFDAKDELVYFSDGTNRLNQRAMDDLGEKFGEDSKRPILAKILESFHEGAANHYEEWFPAGEKTCYVNYYALRDVDGRYLGCMIFAGDISRIQGFRGIRTLENSPKTD